MRDTLRNKPLQTLIACCSLAVIAVCCVCALIPLTAAEAVGGWISAPFRWLQRGSHPDELYWILKDGKEAAFRFGEPCTFSDLQGYRLDSNLDSGTPEPGQADGFARDLPPDEASGIVIRALAEDLLLARDGDLQLSTGLPIAAQLQGDESVYLNFAEQAATSGSISTRSVSGRVKGSQFSGVFYGSQSISDVIAGQGVEQSETVRADLSCPLILVPAD
jgi:hypothetical protein